MDEPQVRALFGLLSDAEMPHSRVNIGLARANGRRKRRRRRAVRSGTPVIAVAVVALFAGGVLPGLPPGPHGPHRSSRPADGPAPAAARSFNPLVPYADFGLLPPGDSLYFGNTGPISQYLAARGPSGSVAWTLGVYSKGRCNLSSDQALRQLRRGVRTVLRCPVNPSGQANFALKRQGPSVNGHLAFLSGRSLAWEYARGSWAVVTEKSRTAHLDLMSHVAAGVSFGHGQPLKFPIQLTGLPAAWRVGIVHFAPDGLVLRGRSVGLIGPKGFGHMIANLDVTMAGPRSSCYFYPNGQSTRRTINGIKVVVNHLGHQTVQVCAAHAHGLFVFVSTYGAQRPGAVSIFSHHLRLLGRDPAGWTTDLLG